MLIASDIDSRWIRKNDSRVVLEVVAHHKTDKQLKVGAFCSLKFRYKILQKVLSYFPTLFATHKLFAFLINKTMFTQQVSYISFLVS